MNAMHYLFMAGGTGGHIFPALAVAKELMARGAQVSWLGTAIGMESHIIPAANIPLHRISIKGMRGKRWHAKLSAPLMLLIAVVQAISILLKIKPSVVIGFGGFASAPGAVAAKLLHKKLIIHEQNAVAGTTNKLLSKWADKKLEAFVGSLPNALAVGNPVRDEIIASYRPDDDAATAADSTSPIKDERPVKLLVLGGSRGAQALNEVIPAGLALLPAPLRPVVWHQTGKDRQRGVDTHYTDNAIRAQVTEFIEDMAAAYRWADLIICRAGALTVSEVSIVGLPAIFIPFPYAIDDHQSHNARWLVGHGAALMERQAALTVDRLAELLTPLLQDKQRLLAMGAKARQLSLPQATRRVADICEEVAGAS